MLNRLLLLLTLTLLASCGRQHDEATALLDRADSLMASRPDSAYALLADVQDEARESWRRADRMRYELTLAEAMNKAYVSFTTDSVMKRVARYYDRHGSANQQLKAHYLLGCTYRDMGEAPAAINAWQEAVEKADTTNADCDYKTLYRVYGQMADIFRNQHLPEEQLTAQNRMSHYSFLAGDTLYGLQGLLLCNSAYYTVGDTAAIFANSEKIRRQFLALGLVADAARAYSTPIHVAVEYDQYERARRMMDEYEQLSGLFGTDGYIIDTTRVQYHSYKGNYYLGIHEIDSAERQFRHIMPIHATAISAYRGLLAVYRERGIMDSVRKYSNLFEIQTTDILKQSKNKAIVQAKGMYDYSRQEKRAQDEEKKSGQLKIALIISLLLSVAIITSFFLYRKQQKLQKEIKELEYGQLVDAYKSNLDKIEELQSDMAILQQGRAKDEKTIQLLKSKQERVRELNELTSDLSRMLKHSPRHSLHSTIKESEIVDLFRHICKSQIEDDGTKVKTVPARKATKQEWDLLVRHTRITQPKFYIFMSEHKLSTLENKVCMLVRFGFKNPEITILTGSNYGSISNVRKKLSVKLFGLNSANELDCHLAEFQYYMAES